MHICIELISVSQFQTVKIYIYTRSIASAWNSMLKLYLYESTCIFMCYLLLSVSDYKALFWGKLATLTKFSTINPLSKNILLKQI